MGKEIPRGEVPTLILAILAAKPCHGYAIAREIEQVSDQLLLLREGTLYPALRAMEKQGWIVSVWETSESGPARKVYSPTPLGEAELDRRQKEWEALAGTMDTLLKRKRVTYA